MKFVLNRRRNFADILTGTFLFLKQEIKPFVKVFCLLVLPLILVDLIFQSTLVRTVWGSAGFQTDVWAEGMVGQTVAAVLSQLILGFWVSLMVLSYLRVYQEHPDRAPGTVTAGEVWQVMKCKLLPLFGWGVLYILIMCLTLMLLIVPGIYFGVTFCFGMYLIVLRDKGVGDGFSGSFIRGEWWCTFGLILVLQVLASVLTYVFAMPYTILTITSTFTGSVPDPYLLTLFLLISNFGKYLLATIFVVGLGLKFYSIAESREHTALYDRIERLGEAGATDGAVD